MTPQERELVDDLFERLATLERNPREADAEEAIRAGLRKAPNATYALVQTVLLQEEALRQANERIRELEAAPPQQQGGGGFLDSMRDAVFGGNSAPPGSVPSVGGRPMGVPGGFPRAGDQSQAQGGAPYQQQAEPAHAGGAGGSFLGTAAAAAAGVIGGTLLMNSLKGMFGGDQAHAHGLGNLGSQQAETNPSGANPWGDAGSGGGDLSRQAGIDSIGKPSGEGDRHAAYEPAHEMDEGDMEDDFDIGFDNDFL
ncbi:DUF2076 domain-containing protein [Pseudorhodoplanes sp.]|uniref:DUF2076 domain-containing protein n=1 Tax=Pseudorhodoplanes sp. TaxID=1934341 RepID=UPI002CB46315|nr:DUF2076 domain-containing protein [Pseudorhodoplanes sp.]HWV54939.1 DUF2076 domain-containing protein [Pseudorhodoplanes sp.]